MNGKRAKKLRKIVYGEDNFRDRKYGRIKNSGMIIVIDENDINKIPKRAEYQRLKKDKKKI